MKPNKHKQDWSEIQKKPTEKRLSSKAMSAECKTHNIGEDNEYSAMYIKEANNQPNASSNRGSA